MRQARDYRLEWVNTRLQEGQDQRYIPGEEQYHRKRTKKVKNK
ncbi:MAG TPA: hypothetical protein VIY08_11535 [Candidatus Nitrosocosmicus sp.]